MQEIEIEICNDGKEKSYSWQLSINLNMKVLGWITIESKR